MPGCDFYGETASGNALLIYWLLIAEKLMKRGRMEIEYIDLLILFQFD